MDSLSRVRGNRGHLPCFRRDLISPELEILSQMGKRNLRNSRIFEVAFFVEDIHDIVSEPKACQDFASCTVAGAADISQYFIIHLRPFIWAIIEAWQSRDYITYINRISIVRSSEDFCRLVRSCH